MNNQTVTFMTKNVSTLAKDLKIQPSQLYVKDLLSVGSFYSDIIGLHVLIRTESRWVLGNDQTPVLELVSRPEYDNASVKSAGLFHNAILYSSRAELARAVLRVLQQAPEVYEGSADHLVSEAFYLHDPENNGIELYYDRPREDWVWTENGIKMDTLFLDPERYIIENIGRGNDTDRKLGHVHLRVGDIPSARRFYVEQLGFDITFDMGSALFVSVGGYHHHMAMNTWMIRGASKRDPELGLAQIRLVIPDSDSIGRLSDRLREGVIPFGEGKEGLSVDDPWGNSLLFTVK